MSFVEEQQRTLNLATRIEKIVEVSESFPRDDPRRSTLNDVVRSEVADMEGVRAGIAAELLGISERSVRQWVTVGVLAVQTRSPRLLLEPAPLLEVRRIVNELRTNGRVRDFLDEVYWRLSDQTVLASSPFAESLLQFQRKEGSLVRSKND